MRPLYERPIMLIALFALSVVTLVLTLAFRFEIISTQKFEHKMRTRRMLNQIANM